MSGKRKKSSLSQSSLSGSDLSDAGRQLEILATKKHKQSNNSGESSGDSDGSRRSRSRSQSKSISRSPSGSDSGTAKSRSGSRSRSGSGSAKGSPASRRNGSASGSGSGGGRSGKKSSSGGSDSGTGGSGGRQESGSGGGKQRSDASQKSSGSERGKKLFKASERRASSKLQSTLSNDSDSELEDNAAKQAAKKIPKLKKKSQTSNSKENQVKTWRDEFDDGLDSDLVGDEDDRDNLNDMTEKQREEELFKRAERREELKKRFEISQKLKLQQKNKEQRSDEQSMNSDWEDAERDNLSNSGQQANSDYQGRRKGYEEKHAKKFSALNNLKAMREEKERKEFQRKEKEKKFKRKHGGSGSGSGSDLEKIGGSKNKNKKMLKASDIYSSSSSDNEKPVRRKSSSSSSSSSSSVSSISSGESDTERHKSNKVVKKARVIDSRAELEKIRLSRFKIDKFVHLPIFKKTVVGCFARIGIGHNKEKNVPVYRVAEITDVCETAKVYDVMKSRTNIGLRMRHGKQERVFRAQFISNQPFTETEFQKWRQTCEVEHVEMPTNQMVAEKEAAIQKALQYRFSSFDVDKILASKEKFSKHPHNYAMTKTKMLKEKGQAEDEGNVELKEKLETQLAELEERAEELDKRNHSGSISTISLINDRNRKDNISRAEKSILTEARRVKLEGHVDDPFTRRKTVPKIATAKAKADSEEEEVEMTTERLLYMEEKKKLKVEEEKAKQLQQREDIRRKMEDEDAGALTKKVGKKSSAGSSKASTQDIFNAHNFDLDINVSDMGESMLPSSIAVKPVTTSAAASTGPTKRSLKIEEWKRRKGII